MQYWSQGQYSHGGRKFTAPVNNGRNNGQSNYPRGHSDREQRKADCGKYLNNNEEFKNKIKKVVKDTITKK